MTDEERARAVVVGLIAVQNCAVSNQTKVDTYVNTVMAHIMNFVEIHCGVVELLSMLAQSQRIVIDRMKVLEEAEVAEDVPDVIDEMVAEASKPKRVTH